MASVWESERVRLERAVCLAHGVPPNLIGSGRIIGRMERFAWRLRWAGYRGCSECNEPEDWEPAQGDYWPCDTILALASIWSDHPQFNPDWS